VFEAAQLRELAARKRLLVAESELNRHLLAIELARIRPFAARIEAISRFGRSVPLILAAALAVAGGFFLAKPNSLRGLISKALIAWQFFNRLKPIWKRWQSRRGKPPPEARSEAEPVSTSNDGS
jgi:hypothetical protein